MTEAAQHTAAGVTYTASDLAPGLRMFRCEPLRASMTTGACSIRWSKAQYAEDRGRHGRWKVPPEERDRLAICRACPIGAAHSGKAMVRYSRRFGDGTCPRCGRGGLRIVGRRLCVSCYNRSREVRAGRNARGNAPVELLQNPPRTMTLLAEIDGEVTRIRDRASCGLPETMAHILQTTKGEILFGWLGPRVRALEAIEAAPDPAGEGQEIDADAAPLTPYRRVLFATTRLMPVGWLPAAAASLPSGASRES